MSSPIIYVLPTPIPAMQGVFPAFKFMQCANTLDEVTEEGYLNGVNLQSNPVSASDVLQVMYSFDIQHGDGIFGIFSIEIVDGVITLFPIITGDQFQPPFVDGDFANWTGTSGKLRDAGYRPSNPSATYVSMASLLPTPPVVGNLAAYLDTTGTTFNSTIPAVKVLRSDTSSSLEAGVDFGFYKLFGTATGDGIVLNSQAGAFTTKSVTINGSDSYSFFLASDYIDSFSQVFVELQSTTTGVGNQLFNALIAGVTSGTATVTIMNNDVAPVTGTFTVAFFII